MKKKLNIDRLDVLAFLNGLVFYAPVALLVRTYAGVTMAQFFVLQAVLSGYLQIKLGTKTQWFWRRASWFWREDL